MFWPAEDSRRVLVAQRQKTTPTGMYLGSCSRATKDIVSMSKDLRGKLGPATFAPFPGSLLQ